MYEKEGKDGTLAAKKPEEAKVSQVGLHLEYLFEYGVDFINRRILISDDIVYPIFHIIDSALSEMERVNKKSITIRINSLGGSIYEALAIVSRIKSSPCRIITECMGTAQSAATLILASGTVRRMSKYSYFMHHSGSYSIRGRHPNNKAEIEHNEQIEKDWAKWMAEFSQQDQEFWYEMGKHVDVYMSPEECLALGVIDEII